MEKEESFGSPLLGPAAILQRYEREKWKDRPEMDDWEAEEAVEECREASERFSKLNSRKRKKLKAKMGQGKREKSAVSRAEKIAGEKKAKEMDKSHVDSMLGGMEFTSEEEEEVVERKEEVEDDMFGEDSSGDEDYLGMSGKGALEKLTINGTKDVDDLVTLIVDKVDTFRAHPDYSYFLRELNQALGASMDIEHMDELSELFKRMAISRRAAKKDKKKSKKQTKRANFMYEDMVDDEYDDYDAKYH